MRIGDKFTLRHLVSLPFSCAPVASALMLAIAVVSAALTALRVWANAAFIDTAIGVFQGRSAQADILWPLAAVAGLTLFEGLRGNAVQLFRKSVELKLRHTLRRRVVEKQARLEYRHIENHDTWDLISRVAKEPEIRVAEGYGQLLDAFALVSTIVSVVGIVLAYAWWVGLLLLAVCVPLFWVSMQGGKKQYDAEKDASKYQRRHQYLFEVMNSRENVEERSLFGYVERLVGEFGRHFDAARSIRVKMQIKWFVRSKGVSIAISVALTGVFIALLVPLTRGEMSPGVMIALVQAIVSLGQMLSWQMSYLSDRLANHHEFMKDVTRFAALEETEGATLPPQTGRTLERLEFKNVRFKYPGTDSYVLDGVSFVIEGGRHYSFVGANGAGKTTITKLITGLYGDYEGEILINGREIRSMPNDELKGYTACVFQDFAKYQITLRENIAMGCAGTGDADARVREAVDAVGLSGAVDALPKGLDQPLGKVDSEGQDLSGGQWQRVALARAVASPAPLRILDEPTAALDPIGESEVYRQFETISRGMPTIFISHRLGSTKLADEIFVIDGGRVAERGAHVTLMRANGVYAEMYESQRSWYQ